jgi:long-chain acyl-CoA synthetase
VAALTAAAEVTPVEAGDVHLLFLPLAHSFARLEAFMAVHRRLTTAFAEGLPQLADNLRDVRPHFIVGVPRVFEKLRERILGRVQEASPLQKALFSCAVDVGRRASRLEQARQDVPAPLRLRRAIARRFVFGGVHRALGGRLRFAVSGGAPLSEEVAEFFHAAGILVLEGYGLTESCPVLSFNRKEHFRFGSVGTPVSGVELRIAPDGEILARGPNIATRGYLHRPEETAEAFDGDGWLHTGDIGRLDAEGFLYITDRKKDLIVTSGGVNIAPQPIENGLRTDPLIGEAMVYGDCRPYPVALVTLNRDAVRRFARAQSIPVDDPAQLVRHPKVLERIGRVIEAQNERLPSYARIKRFAVLPGDFSEAAGELTPTQKLRRKAVAERYGAIIESLYG